LGTEEDTINMSSDSPDEWQQHGESFMVDVDDEEED